jgi:hypothetical protein
MATTQQMLARVVDIFGPAASADPTKMYGNLMVSPAGRVLIGTTTDNGSDGFQVIGSASVSGALKVSGSLNASGGIFETSGRLELGSLTVAASAYVDFHSSGSNNDYDARIISSGGTSGTSGAASLAFYGSAGFTFNTPNFVTLYNASTYSGALKFNANGYAPFIRSNSSTSNLEIVNSANTALNFWINDAGNVTSRGWVCSSGVVYAGGTGGAYLNTDGNVYGTAWGGWLSSWLAGKMGTGGGTFSGGVTFSASTTFNSPVTSTSEIVMPHLRVTASYGSGGGAGLSQQGVTLSWNDGNGDGAGYLAVNQGLGTGGWCIRTVNNGNTSEIGRFTISASGVGTNGSDKRLKKNIKTLKGSLEKLRQLRGVSYAYRSNGEKHYGVIAQEVQPHFPDAVTVTHDLKRHKDVLGVAYNDLIAPLIEAVKELADQLDQARARISHLEAPSPRRKSKHPRQMAPA